MLNFISKRFFKTKDFLQVAKNLIFLLYHELNLHLFNIIHITNRYQNIKHNDKLLNLECLWGGGDVYTDFKITNFAFIRKYFITDFVHFYIK